MMPANSAPIVLIVGAGPIGLTLALQLERFGIKASLIDKAKKRSTFSKALTLTSSSLKLFQGLGVVSQMVLRGKRCERVEIIDNKQRVAFVDKTTLPCQFNYYLSLPQPEIEKILEEELMHRGAVVHYNNELLSLEQKSSLVTASILNCATKQVDTVAFDYVIGCDGAHSVVRKLLNIPFVGPNYPVHFHLADLKFKEKRALSFATYYTDAKGFVGLFAMETGCTRVVIQKNGMLPDANTRVSITEFQHYLDEYLSEKLTITDCVWSTSARIVGRIAKTLHLGNVFLAGDAAHLFSPIGGQTMNTGLQDAGDLGWKLAYVIQGRANKNLLNTYSRERLSAARKVLETTDYYTNLIIGNPCYNKDRERFSPRFHNRAFFKKTLPYLFSGYHANFQDNLSGWVGQHVPYVSLDDEITGITSTYDLPRLKNHVLFILKDFDGLMRLTQSSSDAKVDIMTVAATAINVSQALGLNKNTACLVSPGGYIVAHGSTDAILHYYKSILFACLRTL